ncbi:MAG: cupin domain-containing protein [Chloroflexi bacterium]|nr:cupin domain-containing protein [Chloroflexota bacterium]
MISRSVLGPSTRRLSALLTALAVAAAIAGATWMIVSPSLVHAEHGLPHGTILARGAFAAPTDVKIKSTLGGQFRVMNVKNSADAIVQQVTIGPGAMTGWHSHHGPVVVVVAEGTMTLYQSDDPSCTGETYSAGQVFVDPGQGNAHNARNEGSTGVVLYATYFDVPPGAGPGIPAANPGTCTGF